MRSEFPIPSGRAALAAEILGRGEPVLFLHANVCDRRMWRAQIEAVGATHKAIAYDRRGFGGTRAEAEEFSSVADLVAVLRATAGDAPTTLVACSAGGRIALDAALLHPASVRALVLVAPSVSGAPTPVHPPGIAALLATGAEAEADRSGDPDRAVAAKARLWLDGPLAPEGRVEGEARRLFLDMAGSALRKPPVGRDLDATLVYDRLGEIAAPTLVLSGDLDFPHISERCRLIPGMMPDASHRALPGVAHLPALERPAEVSGLIVSFLTQLPPRRA